LLQAKLKGGPVLFGPPCIFWGTETCLVVTVFVPTMWSSQVFVQLSGGGFRCPKVQKRKPQTTPARQAVQKFPVSWVW